MAIHEHLLLNDYNSVLPNFTPVGSPYFHYDACHSCLQQRSIIIMNKEQNEYETTKGVLLVPVAEGKRVVKASTGIFSPWTVCKNISPYAVSQRCSGTIIIASWDSFLFVAISPDKGLRDCLFYVLLSRGNRCTSRSWHYCILWSILCDNAKNSIALLTTIGWFPGQNKF